MEQKINIAQLLKDCPKGMELDCTICDNVYFDEVTPYMIKCFIKNGTYNTICFHHDGTYIPTQNAKCVIFPKGKTTWEGFQRPFKDGDILATNLGSIFILKEPSNNAFSYGCYIALNDVSRIVINSTSFCIKDCCHLATEEEKQQLFDAIKANGYKWNAEAKTLERLCPFNAGDVLISRSEKIILFSHIDDNQVIYYHCMLDPWGGCCIAEIPDYGVGRVHDCKLATGAQKDILFNKLQKRGYRYNPQRNKIEKLVKPNFKVGDRIRNTHSNSVGVIENLTDTGYDCRFDYGYFFISFKDQHNFILVPNKFDISTLKPFKSEVLVRHTDIGLWRPAIFGFISDNGFGVVGGNAYEQCIPYKGNEHLMGKFDDCDEYYKTWK